MDEILIWVALIILGFGGAILWNRRKSKKDHHYEELKEHMFEVVRNYHEDNFDRGKETATRIANHLNMDVANNNGYLPAQLFTFSNKYLAAFLCMLMYKADVTGVFYMTVMHHLKVKYSDNEIEEILSLILMKNQDAYESLTEFK